MACPTLLNRLGRLKWGLLAAVLMGLLPLLASADSDEGDPSRGMAHSLNIDEAWVENAVYVFAFMDNDFSAGHSLDLEGEGVAAFTKDFGADLAFPQVLLEQPLGQGAAALGPIELDLRYVFSQSGTAESPAAGVFSLQAGGAYWATPNSRFGGLGSTFSAAVLGAFRSGRVFVQGSYGYEAALDPNASSQWVANTAVGTALDSHWVAQLEGDFVTNTELEDGSRGNLWVFVPEVGYQAGDWFLELGEQIPASQSGTTSVLMVERDF